MHKYTIKKLLDISEYKITEIISFTEKEIHIRLEPYKRKRVICSDCGLEITKGYHSRYWSIVENRSMCERRVYLHVLKRRYRCECEGDTHTEKIPWLKKKNSCNTKICETSKSINGDYYQSKSWLVYGVG